MEFHPIFYSYKNYLRLTTFILNSHIIKQETTRLGDVWIQQNVLSLANLNIKRPWQNTESNTVFPAHLTLHNFNFGIRYFSRLIVWGGPGMLLQARITFKNSLGILWEWVLFHIKNGCDDPGFLADSGESDCFSSSKNWRVLVTG